MSGIHGLANSVTNQQPIATEDNEKPPKDRSRQKRPLHVPRLRDKELRIIQVNVRCLRTNIGELANLCKTKEPTIVIVIETFQDETVQDGADSIVIPGYTMCCRRDRNRNGGGITVFCMHGIAIRRDAQKDPKGLELMWFTVTLHSQKLLMGALYIPPSATYDIFDYLDTETLPTMIAFGAHLVMLAGDFNVHHEK